MGVDGLAAARTLLSYSGIRGGYCLFYVWQAYKAQGATTERSAPTATEAWYRSDGRHPGDRNPPPGVPVFWGPKASSSAGDVVISLGGGRVAATDYPYYGVTGTCTIDERERQIGRPYLGWAECIFDQPINLPAATSGVATPAALTPVQEDDMYDDDAKRDAAKRHDAVMAELKRVRQAAAPYKVLSWGTGLVAVNPLNGKFWILPPGYSDLLQGLGYTGGDPFAASDDQLGFATGFLPATIGDRDGDGFTSADLDEIKKAIAGAQVAVTPEQLQKMLDAVGAAARDGGEAGARDALQKLTFVVTAS